MIIYSPICNEDIYPTEDQLNYEYMQAEGKIICVEEKEGKHTIIQLLSTNPHDFMDNTLEPGQEIKMS